MFSMQTLLSYSSDLGVVLPITFIVLTVAAIALGFVLGYKKGVRKSPWAALVWLFAGSVFSICSVTVGGSSFSFLKGKFAPEFTQFVTIFAFALFLVTLGLIAYGLCNKFFRPELRKVKDDEDDKDEVELFDEPKFEYSDDEATPAFDSYEANEEELAKAEDGFAVEEEPETKKSKIFGGIIYGATFGFAMFVLLSLITLFINATALSATGLGVMFDCALGAKMLEVAQACALDIATIGVIVAFACLGWKIGFIKSLRVMIISVGFTAAAVLSFSLPFTRVGDNGFLIASFINRTEIAFGKIGASRFAEVFSRFVAGGCMFLALSVVMVGVCVALHFLVKKFKKPLPNRALDSVLACVCFAIVGVLAVGVFWSGIATLEYADIIGTGSVMSKHAALSNAFVDGLGVYLTRLWSKFIGAF